MGVGAFTTPPWSRVAKPLQCFRQRSYMISLTSLKAPSSYSAKIELG